MTLSETEEKILRSIYALHYLTITQIALLHYKQAAPSMLNYVAAICKRLDEEHEHYLQRGFLAQAVRFGRNPSVFRLATKGITHLSELGLSPLPKSRPADPFPSFEKLKHDLCVNDFIIAARRLCRFHPGYRLTEVRHDWLLRHNPVYVKPVKKTGKDKEAVIPDAWLDFSLVLGYTEYPAPPAPLAATHFSLTLSPALRPDQQSSPLVPTLVALAALVRAFLRLSGRLRLLRCRHRLLVALSYRLALWHHSRLRA